MSHSRRIKTQIVGPAHRFAIVVPPELARTCLNEARWLGIPEPEVGGAGLEFSGRLNDAYTCNLGLRTASRVLCRLEPFRAGVVEELFYKASQIPWDLWLNPEIPLDIEVRVEYSRVSHEKRVGEIIVGGIQKCFGQKGFAYASTAMADEANRDTTESYETVAHVPPGHPETMKRRDLLVGAGHARESLSGDFLRASASPREELFGPGPKQKVLVSLVKNHCQISLDMSGAHLHQRGYRRRHSGAPLRETLAAAVLFKSDWKFGEPLVDGMCGSGTFPIEAALMSRRIPPGFGRDFLFQRWPSFKKESWEYLVRRAMEFSLPKAPETIIGIDMDPEAVAVSAENADRAGVSGDIEWQGMDFFDFNPSGRGLKNGLIVLNPPYGVRLPAGGVGLYEKIGAHLRLNFKGWKYAVLARSRLEAAAMGTGRVRLWNIRHGGMNITIALGRISA